MSQILEKATIRKVQTVEDCKAFTITIPRAFANKLKIGRGDYVVFHFNGDSLIVRKLETVGVT
jgi:bifunctional DNA-binding transcriptional regulator/antitoxin component of YhaV-PrlF toxin-antitoxin module